MVKPTSNACCLFDHCPCWLHDDVGTSPLTLADKDHRCSTVCYLSPGVYMATYVFMNLGAFAVVALLRNSIGSEEDFRLRRPDTLRAIHGDLFFPHSIQPSRTSAVGCFMGKF